MKQGALCYILYAIIHVVFCSCAPLKNDINIPGLDLSDLSDILELWEPSPDKRNSLPCAYITFFNFLPTSDDEALATLELSKQSNNAIDTYRDLYFKDFPTRQEDELDQLRVLAYSLHRTQTTYPLLVLTFIHPKKFPNYFDVYLKPMREAFSVKFIYIVEGFDLGYLWHLNAAQKHSSYFHMANALSEKLYENLPYYATLLTPNQARYFNKFYIWSLIMFKKLIYLDTHNLIRQPLDHLFDKPNFSAVPLVGNSFNTSVMVVEPLLAIFDELRRKYTDPTIRYIGEQAFLNNYFWNITDHLSEAPHELPTIYNLQTRNKNFAIWPTLRKQAVVWHLNGPVRPWDFYKSKTSDWDAYYEPTVFYEWVQARRGAQEALHLESPRQPSILKDKPWLNERRIPSLCDRFSPIYNPKKHQSNTNQFSVLLGTWDRLDLLPTIISHYQASPFVSKIYITWHNPASRPPKALLRILEQSMLSDDTSERKAPVEFLYQKFDSLNNRFNPLDHLDTHAVLVCDDDIMVNLEDIHFAFQVWKDHPDSLVGLFARAHTYVHRDPLNEPIIPENAGEFGEGFRPEDEHLWLYHVSAREATPYNSYSIVLTKFMFLSADYLFSYSCLLPEAVHRYVDQALNCEDIAMSLMISGFTGAKHLAILAPIIDFGTTSGISSKPGHLDCRSVCLTDLIKILGINPLESSIEVVQRYTPPPPNTTRTSP